MHESVYTVTAFKVRDTNSEREIDKWISADWLNAASMYRDAEEVNAQHIQLFTSNEVEY